MGNLVTNKEAVAAYKKRSPNLVREQDAKRKQEKRQEEREALGIDCLPGHLAKRLAPMWTAADVERWYEYAKERGARVTMRKTDLERFSRMDLVPNEPFRIAFEQSYDKPATCAAIVAELGKMEERDNSSYCSVSFKDEGKLREHLGVDKRYNQQGVSISLFCSYQIAEASCKAMGLTPHECGI